ncbi:MAG: hypothetical protein GXP22_00680 [Gammaproteobacteria bacterium]|nr:hypothetical protein [Gammaproteobacteria bacterium]
MITIYKDKKNLAVAVALALGVASVPMDASAQIYEFSWDGWFTMLDANGGLMKNSSIVSVPGQPPINGFQTAISGTLTYDSDTETGSATIGAFDFFSGTAPAEAVGVTFVDAGGGLWLTSMMFNWNGTNGIPVSLVWDASGLKGMLAGKVMGDTINIGDRFNQDGSGGASNAAGAVPASDGTYSDAEWGYLGLGAVPIAMTEWNVTRAVDCGGAKSSTPYANATVDLNGNPLTPGDGCMYHPQPGVMPLVEDTTENKGQYFEGDQTGPTLLPDGGGAMSSRGIGGVAMWDGPFVGSYANFDILNLTLDGDGNGPELNEPADFSTQYNPGVLADSLQNSPQEGVVDIGAVAVSDNPDGAIIEWSSDGGSNWNANDTENGNDVAFTLSKTSNSKTIKWRATPPGGGSVSNATQVVTVTVLDTTAPYFVLVDGVPVDDVDMGVVEEDPVFVNLGLVAGMDLVDDAVLVEWSLDGSVFYGTDSSDKADLISDPSGQTKYPSSHYPMNSGVQTITWRITDDSGNSDTYQQTVTISLPEGMVGAPCVTDGLDVEGTRQLTGVFTMRDPAGNILLPIDNAVTGSYTYTCVDEDCTRAMTLASPAPFQGFNWAAHDISLYDAGSYIFETCPGGSTEGLRGAPDGSTKCDVGTPLSVTVKEGQLGARMLFDWGDTSGATPCGLANCNIDVVLALNFGCGNEQLVTSDPDGDGFIGTNMVDGPFKGFKAAFDLRPGEGQVDFTSGGYRTTVPVVENIAGVTGEGLATETPVFLTKGAFNPLGVDSRIRQVDMPGLGAEIADQVDADGRDIVAACAGDCFDFVVNGVPVGGSVKVVLPLSEPIAWYSKYFKYQNNQWAPFVVTMTTVDGELVPDGKNLIETSVANTDGSCPGTGSASYKAFTTTALTEGGMLEPGAECVQLTIEDGGPNDTDGNADGVVTDPGGVGNVPTPNSPANIVNNTIGSKVSLSGGGCTISDASVDLLKRADWLLLLGFMVWMGMMARRRRQQ